MSKVDVSKLNIRGRQQGQPLAEMIARLDAAGYAVVPKATLVQIKAFAEFCDCDECKASEKKKVAGAVEGIILEVGRKLLGSLPTALKVQPDGIKTDLAVFVLPLHIGDPQ